MSPTKKKTTLSGKFSPRFFRPDFPSIRLPVYSDITNIVSYNNKICLSAKVVITLGRTLTWWTHFSQDSGDGGGSKCDNNGARSIKSDGQNNTEKTSTQVSAFFREAHLTQPLSRQTFTEIRVGATLDAPLCIASIHSYAIAGLWNHFQIDINGFRGWRIKRARYLLVQSHLSQPKIPWILQLYRNQTSSP